MPDDYYYGSRKKFETAIPILIIILLIIGVVALKPELLAGIPIIGDWFAQPPVNVLLIGSAQGITAEEDAWKTHLTGPLAQEVFGDPLNLEAMTVTQADEKITSWDWISEQGNYGVVIITSSNFPSALQMKVRKWVENADGKLLVVGVGGTSDKGRWGEFTEVMPVQCGAGGEDCVEYITTVHKPSLHVKEGKFGHPLEENLDLKTPLTEANGTISLVDVTSSDDIIGVKGYPSAAAADETLYPGISEKSIGMNGKIMYVSFDPTTQNIDPDVEKSMVVNLLAYMTNMGGYKS